MSHSHGESSNPMVRGFQRLQELSAFLLVGTVVALIWMNVAPDDYARIFKPHDPIHFAVNDIFMVFFFGIAMKEVSESFLPGGALSSLSKAATPVIATMGGVFGPIGLFFVLHAVMGPSVDVTAAWAVPTATDIAYSWLFASLIFGRYHPAVTFLLVLAVLDDLIGMFIIAVFYTPADQAHPTWLLLVLGAVIACEVMRRMKIKTFWPYLVIGGTMSWFGLHNAGVHAALALVPVIPFMPHSERDAGLFNFDSGEDSTMNNFEHFFKPIVDFGLFFFGLANAGVVLNAEAFQGTVTWIIFLSLLVGKTVGIFLFGWVGGLLGLKLPKHMVTSHLVVMGAVAGIGFTVALFVTDVAMGTNPVLRDQAGGMLKLGALLSFTAGPVAILFARIFKVEKITEPLDKDAESHGH